ncbi:MAG TPA: DUF1501 domain-containing protein [Pirellulales bacterium]|nr:DUF1501 domain-containing protein [Pirellulales bacterium]
MLRILGTSKRLCDGIRRRDFLRVGGLGLAGLGLPAPLRADAQPAGFGRAKSCILLYLYGSPSQLETFDVKPAAPVEVRGELGFINTVIPGYQIGELLPEIAKIVDRTTVIRSMSHPYPVHGIAYATTGLPDPKGQLEVSPRDPEHWPFIGSVVDYLAEQARTAAAPALPANLALPFPLSTRRANQPYRAGPYGGFLGPGYDPVWTDFQGEGTKPFVQKNRGVVREFRDPYAGIKPDGSFQLAAATLADELTLDRLDRRRSLLTQLDDARRNLDAADRGQAADRYRAVDRYRAMAFSLLGSRGLRDALDVQAEPMDLRESYGMTLYGQGALVARRLVEAGSRFVSLFWDEYGLADSAWDTHYEHFRRMKDELCPTFDRAYSGLLLDLERRGLLDETLVVTISEHGRTPRLSNVAGGGRDHWSNAYSAIVAGGGFARGKVIGKTDRVAGEVASKAVSPKDILATIYHLLGIDPHTQIHDRMNRPFPIAGSGVVRHELLA